MKSEMFIPQYYILEPTRLCNFSCFMCPNKNYRGNEKGHMNLENFKFIVEQIAPFAETIQLYWMGEPFLHPYILDMIHFIKNNTKAKLIISTNGSCLQKSICDQLIHSKLDVLIIDVDATNEETYKKIRTGGDFNVLINNIKYLLSVNYSINVYLQFLEFNLNKDEKLSFVHKWENENCNVSFSWVDTWANQMNELVCHAESLSPYSTEMRGPCADLWNKMVINYLGEVNLCCHDYKRIYKIGNLLNNSVPEIWNNNTMQLLRKHHINAHFTGLCKNCVEWAKESEYLELKSL